MSDQSLLDYVKKGLSDGFTREEIEKVLREAGWAGTDITAAFAAVQSLGAPSVRMSHPAPAPAQTAKEQRTMDSILSQGNSNTTPEDSFFAHHQKAMIIGLITLVALPLLAYGGFVAYEKLVKKSATDTTDTGARPEDRTAELAAAKNRDQSRLREIAGAQIALDNFFQTNKRYPKNLTDLKAYEKGAPVDPKTKEPYLYVAYGDPATHYSLSFILEARVSTLKAGLQVVTSELKLPMNALEYQEATVHGAASATAEKKFLVTDLSKIPFYPSEEVRMEIDQSQIPNLQSVFLVTDAIELVDSTAPFSFSFTAPAAVGQYTVQVFGFDAKGLGYLQRTSLTVTAK